MLLFFYHVPATMPLENYVLAICVRKIENRLLRVIMFCMPYGPSMFSRGQNIISSEIFQLWNHNQYCFQKWIPKYSLKNVEPGLLKVLPAEILSG